MDGSGENDGFHRLAKTRHSSQQMGVLDGIAQIALVVQVGSFKRIGALGPEAKAA
jgi:hypothetical protein